MVKIKHKVTIKRKVAQEESLAAEQARATIEQEQPDTVTATPPIVNPDDGGKKGGKGKWIAAAVAGLLAIGGGAYFASQQNGADDNQDSNKVSTEVVAQNSADQGSIEGEASSDAATQDEGGETPSGADSNQPAVDNPTADTDKGIVAAPASEQAKPQDVKAPAAMDEKQSKAQGSASNAKMPNVQSPSNAITGGNATASKSSVKPAVATRRSEPTGSIEQEALSVIRGDYGVGAERKELLGKRYAEIQRRVNEMYKKGLVH